jgi:AmmeMemoRadiSam system protein B
MIAAVRETERELGGTTVHLAAIDLSHLGPRFGDPTPDERTLGEVEARDRASLEAARHGDAEGWYRSIADHADSTRICGWGATYAMLRCAEPGEGRLLTYERSTEDGGTVVTVAAMAWP